MPSRVPRQYILLSSFAGLGVVGKWYIRGGRSVCLFIVGEHSKCLITFVYKKNAYEETVAMVGEESMAQAANEKSNEV